VYSVCTVTKAESVDVVAAAGERLSALGFRPEVPDGDRWRRFGPDTAIMLPSASGDGMCLARWRRADESS